MLVATTVFACGLVALFLHAWASELGQNRTRDVAALLLAESLASQYRPGESASPEALRSGCQRMIEHAGLAAAVIWNGRNEPLASAAVCDELLAVLAAPEGPSGSGTHTRDLRGRISLRQAYTALHRVEVDVDGARREDQPARLGLIVQPSALLGESPSSLVSFHLPVAATCVVVWWLARGRLQRRLVDPLTGLLATAMDGATERGARLLSDEVDEWAVLDRRLRGLAGDAAASRDLARKLERRMQAQIAKETRRIARDLKRVQRDAWRDALTGLSNRRFLDEKFPAIFAAQGGVQGDLAVIMFDLDHFKPLNDRLGHAAGDRVLTFAGELLQQCTRSEDIAVRHGGDEFLLILPGCSAADAQRLAQRIIALFSQRTKVMFDIQPSPSMTAGVSSLKHHRPQSASDLIRLADLALYRAKEDGRRRVAIHGPRNYVTA